MAQTPFGIASMTVTLNGTYTACASEFTLTTSAPALPYTCTSDKEQQVLASNVYTWGGSMTIAWDSVAATMHKVITLATATRANHIALAVAITTSNAQLITITAATPGIVVTGIDGTFDYEGVPQATLTFVGGGTVTEIVTDPV